jgi:MoxR-like ATPase
VLPAVLDLQRRHARGLAFPGKAALFLRRLAVKRRGADVSRTEVLEEFHAQSGLAVSFLDGRARLERAEVVEALSRQVVGQEAARRAAADVIAVARARLNDPERPLGSLLFLGPTGVGKTQCARALAAFLFGDADKLVRFDMNEFVSPESAARLVGTFANPEGLLTAAVRRQPFAVLLLDEIEKAHPDVFDLLLQVLGEGRLTDALGRTVDFGNTIIVLTSNLGVRQAQSRLGFGGDEGTDPSVYTRAAERFFRPEFFNRLDRIVPFGRLGRTDVRQIARLLIQEVFLREGLLRRKCVLRVEESALERIVDRGFDPFLGARALKRAVERQLTQPVAATLAAGVVEGLTVIDLLPAREGIAVRVQELAQVEARPALPEGLDLKDRERVLERLRAALRRIEGQFLHLRPRGEITAAGLEGEHYRYFAVQEQATAAQGQLRAIAEALEAARRPARGLPTLSVGDLYRVRRSQVLRGYDWNERKLLAGMAAADDVHQYLEDVAKTAAPRGDLLENLLTEAIWQMALLQVFADRASGAETEQVIVSVRDASPAVRPWVGELTARYREAFGAAWGLETVRLGAEGGNEAELLVKGLAALPLAQLEEGTHLFCPVHEGLVVVQVEVWPVPEGADPEEVRAERRRRREAWRERLAEGEAGPDDDPAPLRLVLRVYNENGSTLDVRTGLVGPTLPELAPFVLAALPLPAEFQEC